MSKIKVQQADDDNTYLTIPQMAARLKVSLTTGYSMAKQKDFYCVKRITPKRLIVDAKLLEQWISERANAKGEKQC